MKSITIKGSERESVGKVATKARNAGAVPTCYTEEINNYISAEKHSKTWFTLKRSQL
jgi:ribosomal protein L6P/L9E